MILGDIRQGGQRGLQRRLYEALRSAILSGRLPPGSRLPPTRALAEEYGLARQTVVLVYERLLAEGYAVARVGSGTYVSSLQPAPPASPAAGPAFCPPRSAWADRALAVPRDAWPPAASGPAFDFRPGVPDWTSFPRTRWRRLLARRLRGAETEPALGQYGDPAGYRPLREALASYLAQSRGLRCTADQVVITSGSQQALDLLARVCLNPGDVAAVEEPGYPPARAILAAAGARVQPVPVDEQGLVVEALGPRGAPPAGDEERVRSEGRPAAERPRLVYVTPSHQYPLGVTLSLSRRLELLEWAARLGALIIEDDYDSELRYSGPPLPALQGPDERGCVAYVGSCSSVLFPPLRVGWIVAPPALVEALVAAKWLADRQTSTLDQQVLADFIQAGDLARHLRRSRRLYARRREALASAVARHLAPGCRLAGEAAGLQTPLFLPARTDERAVVTAAAARGVGVYPLGPCYGAAAGTPASGGRSGTRPNGEGARRSGLLMGFAAMSEDAIAEGIRRLAAALRQAAR